MSLQDNEFRRCFITRLNIRGRVPAVGIEYEVVPYMHLFGIIDSKVNIYPRLTLYRVSCFLG